MKKLKQIISFVAVCCMLSMNTNAEIHNEISTVENGVAVGENSSPYVNVIKEIDGQKTTIYSGALSGYADGVFNDVDFSENSFMIVFDWDSAEEEAIYVVPTTNQTNLSATAIGNFVNMVSQENIVELQSEISTGAIHTNMALVYDNVYHENVLLPGQTLSIPITIINTGNSTAEFMSYIAQYDLSGRLTELTPGNLIMTPANQTVTTTLSTTFKTDAVCTAKIFLWKKSNITPVSDSIYLTIQNQDYYADTYTEANRIDIDKQLCGVINTSTDIDIIKFTPAATGLYALQLDASNGTVCGLYDSTQTLLNSVSAVTEKNYLLYSLTANQDYYIRFNGAENSSYKITPTLPNEIVTLTKNIGTASSLSESDEYNVYKFIPSTTGNYIITAVDSENVNAELYDASFEKVASVDVSDTSVSFRITNNMIANQTYYVVVYPKSDTALGSYTMYVEEPFALISIE